MTASRPADFQDRSGLLEVPGAVSLHHGGTLGAVQVAWRLAGPAGAPVVAAIGGISADRNVFPVAHGEYGWWHTLVGPGNPLDT
ncbi:MAG: hypothetical protein KA224_07570, partial [Steroidobacteraceae bacterium]|nr:hypothetical protein [Steroidobacteraceae bacterium]